MIVLVVLEGVVLALLAVLVVGLLRTHAEILRRLHDLGAGVYDDQAPARPSRPARSAGPDAHPAGRGRAPHPRHPGLRPGRAPRPTARRRWSAWSTGPTPPCWPS